MTQALDAIYTLDRAKESNARRLASVIQQPLRQALLLVLPATRHSTALFKQISAYIYLVGMPSEIMTAGDVWAGAQGALAILEHAERAEPSSQCH